MEHYRHIQVERRGDARLVRLRHSRLEETEIHQFGEEMASLIVDHGCRELALSLGPQPTDCLYSVFLAKLVSLRNLLLKHGGRLVLCEVPAISMKVFEACALAKEFVFVADFAAAMALFQRPQPS
jgi:hypothetical protein